MTGIMPPTQLRCFCFGLRKFTVLFAECHMNCSVTNKEILLILSNMFIFKSIIYQGSCNIRWEIELAKGEGCHWYLLL